MVGETLRLVLEVRFHFELRPEITGNAGGLGHAATPEPLVPLVRGTIRDGAQLARQSQAEPRPRPGS